MRIVINLNSRHLLAFVLSAVVVLAIGSGIAQTPNPGHSWGEVGIPDSDLNGIVDQADNAYYATSAGSAGTVNVVVDGVEKSLQDAIDDGDIGGIGKPDYDSGWFNVTKSTVYNKNHGLGTRDYTVLIWFREGQGSSYYNVANYYEQPYRNSWDGDRTGAVILEQGDNYIKILTGDYVNGIGFTDLDSKYYKTSGQYRILLWAF